jgi:hypothetical protein
LMPCGAIHLPLVQRTHTSTGSVKSVVQLTVPAAGFPRQDIYWF